MGRGVSLFPCVWGREGSFPLLGGGFVRGVCGWEGGGFFIRRRGGGVFWGGGEFFLFSWGEV